MTTETFLATYLAKRVIDASLTRVGDSIKAYQSTLECSPTDLENALQSHLTSVSNWSAEVGFADSATTKLTTRIFVELDCYVIPRSLRINSEESPKRIRMEDLFVGANQHLMFLGTPGAGKTTSMKNLCNRLLHDTSFAGNQINYPIVVKLRDLSGPTSGTSLLENLLSILGVVIGLDKSIAGRSGQARKVRSLLQLDAVSAFLNESRALLILDGFDEIPNYEHRRSILEEVRSLAIRLDTSTLVMTSRTGEFVRSVDNAKVFEICPLTKDQIAKFARKWLKKRLESKLFLEQIAKSPFSDAAMKPLNLAHLCALFERIGSIPERPKTVYRKILRLLLEEWDEQRSVRRSSQYSKFEADRKYDFLSSLAFHLTAEKTRLTFGSQTLITIYKTICADFSLPIEEAKEVAQEIESHTGLLLKSGFDEYEFAHKSLQEFLVAEFIVRLPRLPNDSRIILRLPNELAIAVTISSSPTLYFVNLILDVLQKHQPFLKASFYSSFITRLVQEKPDFDGQDTVVLALLVLYSMTLDAFSEGGAQLPLFLIDPMLSDYETLVLLAMRNGTCKPLASYYRIDRESSVLSEHMVMRLVKIRDLKDYELPTHVYARKTFLEQFGDSDILSTKIFAR